MNMKYTLLAALMFASLSVSAGPIGLLNNSGFELGTIGGWTTTNTPLSLASPSCNLSFGAAAAANGCGVGNDPVSGQYAAYASTSFPNSAGQYTNTLSQSFVVPTGVAFDSALFSFLSTATTTANGSLTSFDITAQLLSGSTVLATQTFSNGANPAVPWTNNYMDVGSLLSAHIGDTLTLQLTTTALFQRPTSALARTTKMIIGFDDVQVTLNPVPEPPTIVLMASVLGLGVLSKRLRLLSFRAS